MKKEKVVKIVCSKCPREYNLTEELRDKILMGKAENECYYCDGSHDVDGDDR